MKILVAGYKGMLGTDLYEMLCATHQHEVFGVDVDTLNLLDYERSLDYISELKPDCIINCAAHTNVDGCESEITLAYQLNGIIPRNLAVIAQKLGCKLVHISTDYVFDGNGNQAYMEQDCTNPVSVYGKSKLLGEQNVQAFHNQYFIIRTQWLYGIHGNNFVKTMLRLAKEHKSIKVVNDQFGSPTYTRDLAAAIIGLINTEYYGIYHITNSGVVTWNQFTRDIFELSQLDTVVEDCTTAQFPRPAVRPKYSALNNFSWALNGFDPIRNYKEALREYLIQEAQERKV